MPTRAKKQWARRSAAAGSEKEATPGGATGEQQKAAPTDLGFYTPTAMSAGIQTAKARRLLEEGQARTRGARLAVAFVAGVKLLSEQINEQATLAKLNCSSHIAVICGVAFGYQPPGVHSDIFDELATLLKLHFEAFQYTVHISDPKFSFVRINLSWTAPEQLSLH